MIQKHPIRPQRIRKVPGQFSWVDHRLVRDRFIESISHPGAALYLFLVTVADSKGLSYYSEASLMTRLAMDPSTLADARKSLIAAGLIVYEKPIYQVLSLEPAPEAPKRAPLDQPLSVAQIFKQMMGGSN